MLEMMAEGSTAVPEDNWGMDRGSSRDLWLLYKERPYCHDNAVYNQRTSLLLSIFYYSDNILLEVLRRQTQPRLWRMSIIGGSWGVDIVAVVVVVAMVV